LGDCGSPLRSVRNDKSASRNFYLLVFSLRIRIIDLFLLPLSGFGKKRMNRRTHSNIWKSGLLIALFLFPSFSRPLHISYEKTVCAGTDGQSSHHDAGKCPTCLFHYFAFTEIELPELNPELFLFSVKPSFYSESEYQPFPSLCFPRGPPLAIP
jgi:hypothetical protein